MSSYNSFLTKPENALRRAQELASISQPGPALALLHESLSSRRHKTWSVTYEKIIIFYLDLCLDLGRSREAKDGLHQYRNLSQSQAPGSLEGVIRHLVDRAEKRCRDARDAVEAYGQQAAQQQQVGVGRGGDDGGEAGGGGRRAGDDDVATTNTAAVVAALPAVVVAAVDDIDDDVEMYDANLPQSILLSTMSSDPQRAQREAAVLFPALKFLWESYRAVLDILKSNSKLERLYHAIACSALRFCGEYRRRVEYRRLCDMMRMHLGNLARHGGVNAAKFEDGGKNNKVSFFLSSSSSLSVRGWEGWTAESIELHLQTRFVQLETSSTLRLFTEGFRTVEDIYNILQISRARRKLPGVSVPPPKAKILAAYYEKLTSLFWVSENHLFHAFAWYKYYSLCREYNRGMSPATRRTQASAVLLAALCIPPTSAGGGGHGGKSDAHLGGGRDAIQSTVEDDIAKEKTARLATLLGFHTTEPSREAILAEIRARDVMEDVPEYLREMYVVLEDTTDPLDMVERARSLLDALRAETGMTKVDVQAPGGGVVVGDGGAEEKDGEAGVVAPVEEDHALAKYVAPLTNVLILKLISNLSSAYHTISLEHVKSLTAGLGVSFEQMEKSIVLSTRSRAFSVRIDHRMGCIRFGDANLEGDGMRGQLCALARNLAAACDVIRPPDVGAVASTRAPIYADVRSSLEHEHLATLERRVVIERRKEEAERLVQERLRQEEAAKRAEEAARKAEEDRRLDREQKMREREKLQRIQEEMDAMEKKRYLTAMGRSVENMTAEELKTVDTAALAKEHAEKANKKREEAERKVRETARQLDYIVRAVRIEELARIKEGFELRVKEDRRRYEEEVVEQASKAKDQWETDVKEKAALEECSVFDHTSAFESMIMSARKILHIKACEQEDERAELEAEKGKLERARSRKEDELRRIEEERLAAEREEVERRAEEERQRKEEERRARQEELERKERLRMEEQRERDARERMERSQPLSGGGGRGMDAIGGGGGSLSSGGGGGGSSGKYIPPSRRDAGGGGGGSSRWGGAVPSSDRGGGYGGGRYDGSRDGGGGGRFDGSRDGGGRDSDIGGGSGRFDSRDGGRDSGGPPPTNSRWS
ncbi:hypothetical protein ACHAW5_006982 [Stephanodiscus triporus]|uniref:Eukaryotic translation initiation factor 3 subunit A n=1 Tax=Stephanodiscus triporus TaxID=2934178 RepID=A0ABD3PIV8_9STRA